MDNESHSFEDLAANPSFQRWALQQTQEDIIFWEEWMQSHPEEKEAVRDAKALITLLHMPKQPVNASEIEQAIEDVKAEIVVQEESDKPSRKVLWSNKWWQVAAVFVGILLTSMITYVYLTQKSDTLEYVTQYGEMKEVKLPDGSIVTLSGNSQLKVSKAWLVSLHQQPERKNTVNREVWIEGMAYFKVKHLNTSASNNQPIKFIVHAADVNVEVIGTEFNVSNRAERVKVVLNSGKIQLQIEDKEQVAMKPGELVELIKQDNSYQIKQVDSNLYTTWKNGELLFDHTSLAQVARLIEDAYGYKVTFQSEKLKDRKLSGSIQNRDLSFLLHTISVILTIEAHQQGNQIIISEPSMSK